jgi:hypothetical protein
MSGRLGLEFKYIGDWGHDLNRKKEQEMLFFKKPQR